MISMFGLKNKIIRLGEIFKKGTKPKRPMLYPISVSGYWEVSTQERGQIITYVDLTDMGSVKRAYPRLNLSVSSFRALQKIYRDDPRYAKYNLEEL